MVLRRQNPNLETLLHAVEMLGDVDAINYQKGYVPGVLRKMSVKKPLYVDGSLMVSFWM